MPTVPAARFKQCLVIVAGQGRGLVFLDERTLAAAFAAGADLHRVRRIIRNHKRLVVAAHSVGGTDRGSNIQRTGVSRVLRVVFIDRRGNDTRPKGRRAFFLIADGAALGRMLGAEACRFHYAGRMMRFCSECGGDFLCDVHAVAALVIQHDAVATC